MSAFRFERPWKVWEALEFWETWKQALEGGPGRELGGVDLSFGRPWSFGEPGRKPEWEAWLEARLGGRSFCDAVIFSFGEVLKGFEKGPGGPGPATEGRPWEGFWGPWSRHSLAGGPGPPRKKPGGDQGF